MVAEAIIEGRALVCRSVSPELAMICKPDIVGKPLPETYTEPGYAPILGLLEFVMVTGCPVNTLFKTPLGLCGWVSMRRTGPEQVALRYRRVPRPASGSSSLRGLTQRAAGAVAALVAALGLPAVG